MVSLRPLRLAGMLLALCWAGSASAQGRMGREFGNLRAGDCAAVNRFAAAYGGRDGYSNYAGRIELLRTACRRASARSQALQAPTPAPRPTAVATRRPTPTRVAPTPPRRVAVRTPTSTPAPSRPRPQVQRPVPPTRVAAARPRPTPTRIAAARPAASRDTPVTLPRTYTPRNPFTTTPPPEQQPREAPWPIDTAPAPPPGPTWVSATELLTYLRTNILCYDYDTRRGECASVEELQAETPGAISLKRTFLVDVTERSEVDRVAYDLGFRPLTARFELPLSLFSTGPDLCWGRETAGRDARRLQVSVTDDDPYRGNVPLRGQELDQLRDMAERDVARRPGSVVCRRYRWIERGRILQEQLIVDNRSEPGDTIRLIARPGRDIRLALLASVPE